MFARKFIVILFLFADRKPLAVLWGGVAKASSVDGAKRNSGVRGFDFPYYVALHTGYLPYVRKVAKKWLPPTSLDFQQDRFSVYPLRSFLVQPQVQLFLVRLLI